MATDIADQLGGERVVQQVVLISSDLRYLAAAVDELCSSRVIDGPWA